MGVMLLEGVQQLGKAAGREANAAAPSLPGDTRATGLRSSSVWSWRGRDRSAPRVGRPSGL